MSMLRLIRSGVLALGRAVLALGRAVRALGRAVLGDDEEVVIAETQEPLRGFRST